MMIAIFLAFQLVMSPQNAAHIGERIWKNECAGRVDGLTHWNEGESFASLGIGHFLWFPAGCDAPFEEMFPKLVIFLQKEKVAVPAWIKGKCPWKSRGEFIADLGSEKMGELRKLLFETRGLQAVFIAERLEKLCLGHEKKLSQLAAAPGGLFALIDYLNFKGSGLSEKERYKGKGWGLIQVLDRMKEPTVKEFVRSAKEVLGERVKNAPSERGEQRWLKGWFNRLDSYFM